MAQSSAPSFPAQPHHMDLAALALWMDGQGLGSGPIEDAVALAGGTQNLLLRFTRAGRSYVLRRPPQHLRANSNETMRREAQLLKALAGTAVPHPAFIAVCLDEQVLGAVFYLMEPIEGFNATNGLPPLHAGSATVQHRMGLAMAEGIAALGALDYKAVGLQDFGKPDNYLARQVSRWKSQLDSYADFAGWPGESQLGDVARVGQWLEANRPAQFTPGIMHGDFHIANVMFRNDSGELAAIVDWELSTIGDPLIDMGWLLATWPQPGDPESTLSVTPWIGFPTAEELVSHYGKFSSRDLSAMPWYRVLACYKLAILLEGTHARACAGKAPKETGDKLHAKAVQLFERAIGWM